MIPKLSGSKLKNHSFQHSFLFKKERGKSVMRAKKYPQHSVWGPEEGIQLLKDNQEFEKVPVSPFRVEKLMLDKVYSDLVTKYFPTLELANRREVQSSWERTKATLENLPKKMINLPLMDVYSLPRQVPAPIPTHPMYLELFLAPEERELEGQKCIQDAEDGDFFDEIQIQMDVAVYSEVKSKRPWIGRVVECITSRREFQIHWYEKKARSLLYYPSLNKDGSPLVSVVSVDCVMFWEFTTKSKIDESFKVSREWFDKVMDAYKSHDQCNI